MADARHFLLTSLLRDVSRSFYLTLRILPASIREPIGLAYLLARTTDTIADAGQALLEQRLEALQKLSERIEARSQEAVDLSALARQQKIPAERVLLENCEESLALLHQLSASDRQLVRDVLLTIVSGQQLDLRRFAGASEKRVIALRTDAELDDYTYRVAGCVGEFWTKMCRAHLFPRASLDEVALLANGIRFGKGLQLVNVLRDLPADLRRGRCYLPAEALAKERLEPGSLLDPGNEQQSRPVYNRWIDQAEAHLTAGWRYTNTLPRRCVRLRLACAWPLLIGQETVKLLRSGRVLDPSRRIKVGRPRVRSILCRSVLYYPWPGAWYRLFQPSPSIS
jgi:farnesyl-diphosphate farnesyltransferase